MISERSHMERDTDHRSHRETKGKKLEIPTSQLYGWKQLSELMQELKLNSEVR
jgi:hypothetical protein